MSQAALLATSLRDLIATILPKKQPAGGATRTATFQPYAPDFMLHMPTYLEHLQDIAQEREHTDSKQLIKDLLKLDPDISAALHAYLTLADTKMIIKAVDLDGNIDPKATRRAHQLITKITRQVDYTQGYTLKENLDQTNSNMRYMVLMRGGIPTELVLDNKGAPSALRLIDSASLRWYEPKPGLYKPSQLVIGEPLPRLLDYPTFRVSFYRRDPTTIYTHSDFVSAINTVTYRQAVINDLYRIMRLTGYPRMDIKILESVILDHAPLDVKSDQSKRNAYVNQQLASASKMFQNVRVDQALTHTDSVEVSMLGAGKASGVAIDITPIIETLNAQNQAALKTMATVIGRGQAGVNTGSVEARMAALYADQLNKPIGETWGGHLSWAMHQEGFQGWVDVEFRPAELRPATELEPQLVLKAQRLRQDLSDGIITDTEYTLDMYGRLPDDGAPKLSGTKFMSANTNAGGDADAAADVSPNSDPLGRSVSPARTKQTKANPKKSK
jgi:hypothetical protein